MRGHQLLELADDLRTNAKLERTGPEPDPCVICGARPVAIVHAPYGVGPKAGFCADCQRARRVGHG